MIVAGQPFMPNTDHFAPETPQRIKVGRNPVVREVTTQLLAQCLVNPMTASSA